jgi:pSer/pThr/pTyr-binding forkhead associated (FHA) protein
MEGNKRQTARLDDEPGVDTKKIDGDELARQYMMDVPEALGVEKGLALYLPRLSEPLVIADRNIITLGRKDPISGIDPVVDLTNHHGAELGVSRFHAEISITDGRYYMKDMGSTNGTWINGKRIHPYRLTPLRSGDQVRLGHLSIVIG